MTDFWIYLKIGFEHVLNLNGYDHLLFLMALTVPYAAKDWKRLLLLVSLFTLGHTLSLFLAVLEIITVKPSIIEFLIPITICMAALFNIIRAGKPGKQDSITFVGAVTLFFGLIHGLGFSNYFNHLLPGEASDKMLPMLEFALGIEGAQICIVLLVLLIGFIFKTLFRFNQRDFVLIFSAFVLGVVVPLLLQNPIWEK
ncbi:MULTISPECIES: HupE/UreJ family protein [Flavobacterium]|uniref:HupE/UreJ family protein n=1 Tax=Flavobacterium stagni TaxID=2506421 RepID=A0A4V1N2Y7_9FLAO|nr:MULTISPECIES: HupE/UreJ family protein [Flavobacterium]RXR24140.1 HupE/UreJ family protein [Flavobacterium stagni]